MFRCGKVAYFSAGAFFSTGFGAGSGLNMLAQVLFPSGITVDTTAFAMSAAPPHDSVAGLESSDGASLVDEAFQTID